VRQLTRDLFQFPMKEEKGKKLLKKNIQGLRRPSDSGGREEKRAVMGAKGVNLSGDEKGGEGGRGGDTSRKISNLLRRKKKN